MIGWIPNFLLYETCQLKNKTQCESHKISFMWAFARDYSLKTAQNYLGVGWEVTMYLVLAEEVCIIKDAHWYKVAASQIVAISFQNRSSY